ncbi:hypothetical protein N7474_002445 [Penicillium riverlandense]|uniref:uncharacterized protein n=1 Tax=Penicillium riverlandense TaxID=1903569 RepID=UPI00254751B4|nr:uncharacterized protein N7474_002445 [Penicillium riverlandense]KAJ5825307.1 hypothetical protein N7474_002445 [Penicillium riverlandense]
MSSASIVPHRRRRDEDDEESDSSTSSDPSQTSSTKRPRLNSTTPDDDSSSADEENEDTDSQQAPAIQLSQPPSAQNGFGPGGYKPGAIVRIKVTDFVTYTSAEFFPGPKLNMVIGPNGTGKSTLVCAICLGLGWGPTHLGRAKETGEFVKHGCREATIEIELAGPPLLRRNVVITRNIKRDGNKSTFTINGKPVSKADVLKAAQKFSIQVDNLCQFLPQDKVAEFAALTPVELLHSTQRAAAGPEMVQWHDGLKKLRAEQKRLDMDHRADKDVLTNLENRQEMQRADVERLRQRTEIQRKIEILEFLRPVMVYKDHHKARAELEARKEELSAEYNQLMRELEPAMRAVTAKDAYAEKVAKVKKHQRDTVTRLSQAAKAGSDKIDELRDSIKDLNGQIEAERKSSQKHKAEATNTQQTINKLRRQLEEEAVELDVDYYNEKLKAKRLQGRDLETRAREIKDRRAPIMEKISGLQGNIKEAQRQLKNLDSVSGRQEAKLEKLSSDSYKAYQWILRNQDKFEKEVFGPPLVTCSVKDPKYADALESLFQRADFTVFTVQCRQDFRTLQQALTRDLELHDFSIKTCSMELSSFSSPFSDDELRQLGFDGWAKDYLSGPEPVLALFCSENRMHQTPISLRDISDEDFARLETGSLSSWVAGKRNYQVTRRREYGPDATSTRVRQIKPAQAWTSQPVDDSVRRGHQQNINMWNSELQEAKDTLESEKAAVAEVKASYEQNEREKKEIEAEKAEKQTAHTQHRAIPEKINQQETKLHGLQELFKEVRQRVLDIRNRQDEISIEQAEATLEYADTVQKLQEAHEELIKIEILHVEATSDLATLRQRHSDSAARLEEKNAQLRNKINEIKEMAARGRELQKKARIVYRTAGEQPDAEAVLENLGDHDLNRLNADIDSEKARLELTQGGDSNTIREFEEREKQIGKLRDKLSQFQTKLSEIDTAIAEIRRDWEPRLDALIQKISDAFADSFARIGCAGQVSLDKVQAEPGPDGEPGGHDFDQWSIQIHVKFRDHENLSLLNSHRQSGGERAVSTIFYLMALQSLSASPFRVVDEINQGMDPRNERMVHGRLVDIACDSESEDGSGGGQYFLITPKLLTGLAYKPGMRVLCIYSGEHMPKDYAQLDFKLAIRNMKAIKEKGGQSTGTGPAIASSSRVDVYA